MQSSPFPYPYTASIYWSPQTDDGHTGFVREGHNASDMPYIVLLFFLPWTFAALQWQAPGPRTAVPPLPASTAAEPIPLTQERAPVGSSGSGGGGCRDLSLPTGCRRLREILPEARGAEDT